MNTDTLNELKEYKSKLLTKINFLLEDLLNVSNERVRRLTNELLEELKMELKDLNERIKDLADGNIEADTTKNDNQNVIDFSDRSEIDNENENDDDDEVDDDEVDDDDDDDDDDEVDDDEVGDDDDDDDDDDDVEEDSTSDGQAVYVGRKDNGDIVAIFNEDA